MFGSLKKKLKEIITGSKQKEEKKEEIREELDKDIVEKIDSISKIEPEPAEEIKEEKIEDEILEEPKIEELQEEEEISKEVMLGEIEPEDIEEKIEEEIREEMGDIEELREEEIKTEEFEEELKEEEPEPEIFEEPERIEEKKKGFFGRLFKKVKEKTISEDDIAEILKDLQMALVENDVAFEVSEKICDDVKKSLVGKNASRRNIEDLVSDALRDAMLDVMKQEKIDLKAEIEKKKDEPYTIIFLGFNGTGKTTSMAKIANKFKAYSPVLAAADTFRAASIEQIEVHGRNLGLEVIKHKYGADSAAVIFDAKNHAKATGSKLVLADTAGRSHSNVNLMDELKKVCRVNKPDLKILVLDAVTGNDIYDQSKLFNDAVEVDAIILTKTDVYEKGGSALSAAYTIKKPILFLGTGQEYTDLVEFDPEKIVQNLLD